MDIDSGREFISELRFQLNVISESYDKVAALRISEITSNVVIKEIQHAMFLVQRIQMKLKHYEHVSSSDANLVTTSQASLLLEKLNEVNRLTKIYRAVRILRNERSRFGKDLSPEDCGWADHYLELCRRRGLNLVSREYASNLLTKITETISVYRLLTIKKTITANMNFSDPCNLSKEEYHDMHPIRIMFKLHRMRNDNYPQGNELLKKLIVLRDKFSKLLGFENYIDFALQSQTFTRKKANVVLFSLANLSLSTWISRRTTILQNKLTDAIKHNSSFITKFDYMDMTYYHRLVVAGQSSNLNQFFHYEHTIEKIMELVGEYFGLDFTLKETDENRCRIYRVFDVDTDDFLGMVVLDLFSLDKKKPAMKTTIALHEADKIFTSDFLANLDDEFKVDSRFEEFQTDSSSPLICYVITDIRDKYGGPTNQTTKDCPCSTPAACHGCSPKCPTCVLLDQQIHKQGNLLLSLFDVLHICHELGYVLWHIFGQASSQIFRTCCSERDFVDIPSAILQYLILQPKILQRITSFGFDNEPIPEKKIKELVAFYKWEEPFKRLSLIQNGYLDHFSHITLMEPDTIISTFATEYFMVKEGQIFLCPDLKLTLTERTAGHQYSKIWAHHVGKMIFEATFMARDLDLQVGRDFRRYFLEPDLNVDFRVRLRNFLGEDPNSKSSLEQDKMLF